MAEERGSRHGGGLFAGVVAIGKRAPAWALERKFVRAVMLFMEQRGAKEIQAFVVGGRLLQQLQRRFQRFQQISPHRLQIGQADTPAGPVRRQRGVEPAIGHRLDRSQPD